MDKFLDEQEALVSRSSSPGEAKTLVAGKTEAGAATASANNNSIPISTTVPSPQAITPSQTPVT